MNSILENIKHVQIELLTVLKVMKESRKYALPSHLLLANKLDYDTFDKLNSNLSYNLNDNFLNTTIEKLKSKLNKKKIFINLEKYNSNFNNYYENGKNDEKRLIISDLTNIENLCLKNFFTAFKRFNDLTYNEKTNGDLITLLIALFELFQQRRLLRYSELILAPLIQIYNFHLAIKDSLEVNHVILKKIEQKQNFDIDLKRLINYISLLQKDLQLSQITDSTFGENLTQAHEEFLFNMKKIMDLIETFINSNIVYKEEIINNPSLFINMLYLNVNSKDNSSNMVESENALQGLIEFFEIASFNRNEYKVLESQHTYIKDNFEYIELNKTWFDEDFSINSS